MIVKRIEKVTKSETGQLKQKYITEEKVCKKPTAEEIEKELKTTKEFIEEIDQTYPEAEEITSLLKEVVTQGQRDELQSKGKESNPNNEIAPAAPKRKRGRPKKTDCSKNKSTYQRKDKILSFIDPDARFGHKSDKKTFCGYKAHAAMDESGIVTSVDTFGGNENECTKLKKLLQEEEENGITSEAVTADGLYDPAHCRQEIKNEGMQAFIPSPDNERQIDEGFTYDPHTDKVICPQGKISKGNARQDEGNLHYFSTRDCKNCLNPCHLKKNMTCAL